MSSRVFFFNDTATTEIYTLSLHDALPIYERLKSDRVPLTVLPGADVRIEPEMVRLLAAGEDRKSTRLNSSHANISYAVFCLKKKKGRAHRTRNTKSTCSRRNSSGIRRCQT